MLAENLTKEKNPNKQLFGDSQAGNLILIFQYNTKVT
jgi:hypothetical protein